MVDEIIEKLKQNPARIRVRDVDGTEFEATVTHVESNPARDELDDATIDVGLEANGEAPGAMEPEIMVSGTGGYETVQVHYYENEEEIEDVELEQLEVLME